MNLNNQTFYEKLYGVEPVNTPYIHLKRGFDFVFGLILAIVAIPIILIFAVAVRLETPGSPFYKQERVGLMGRRIYITKIRSMYQDAESNSGAVWAQKHDARITKIGAFMRNTRIDELPQIWNVLKGELSFIGPRPERPGFTQEFSETYPGFEQRLRIVPGLSGLAQVRGGYDATPSQKLVDDMEYIETVSFKQDVKIVLNTVGVVITGRGAH